jgi:hypothetical protein
MAVPFLSVNLRTPACDFEPLMLAPDHPMLDLPAGQASCRILRKWLGDLVAEPCWTSTGVVYFLPTDDASGGIASRPQCILPRDLRSGPIRDQYLKLWQLLSRVQPEPGETELLSAVCRSFESPDRATRMGQLGDCLFKYRDGHKRWRLVWAWGYRRKAGQFGPASLCPRCSLLTARSTGEALRCPACGWRPRSRLLTAAALAALLLGIGLGLWASTHPNAAEPKIDGDQIAAAPTAGPTARIRPVEHLHVAPPPAPSAIAQHVEDAVGPTVKITQPLRPRIAATLKTPVHPVVIVESHSPPRPAPVKARPVTVVSTTIPSRVIPAVHPAAIVAQSTSTPLPDGVRVDQDGKVFLGYRPVATTFDATTQFAPTSQQPSRYIYGSHVYAESRDTLHGGDPAIQQWQHYVMSDELSARPAGASGADHSVSLVLLDRGTDAEVSNASTPGVDTWADNGSPVHLVQTSTSRSANPAASDPFAMPRFDLTIDRPEPFYPTTPRCHGKHHRGYGPYIRGAADPALYRRFTPTSHAPALDANLTVVALQYFGHSSPDEVLADLEAARAKAQEQAATSQQNSDSRHAILQLCDSEIALWRDVIDSSATADAASAAYKAGDVPHAGDLCRQYQSQVAAYANRPEWSLFETQAQQVAALAEKLSSPPSATR